MDLRVSEFQCIMPLDNIPSVLKPGILSNERAAKLPHHAVTMQEVQDRAMRVTAAAAATTTVTPSIITTMAMTTTTTATATTITTTPAAAVTASAGAPAAL
jgi:hypothetical protein